MTPQGKKFIYCKDKDIVEQLIKHYKLISKNQDGTCVFENTPIDCHLDFSKIDYKKKVAFSNRLLF